MFRYSQVLSKTGKTLRGARQSSQVAHQPVTMSEVPVPSGSWAAHNEAMQKRYNNHLYGGIAFSAFTLYMGVKSGYLYLNNKVPALPEE